MGNGNSKDNAPEAPGLIGKLGGIPRAAAITEGRRAKGGQPKLPPNAIRSQPEDWAFIEVWLHLSSDYILTFTSTTFCLQSSMPAVAATSLRCSHNRICHPTCLLTHLANPVHFDQPAPSLTHFYTADSFLKARRSVQDPGLD